MRAKDRRVLTAIGIVAAPIVVLYLDDWVRLIPRWWSDPNYTHGFFIPLFSLYFVWEKWETLKALPARPSLLGLPWLLSGAAVKLWTLYFPSPFVSCVSMILVISGAVLLTAGRQVFRETAVPVLFLFLMMPLPVPIYNQVALPLRRSAAIVGTTVLQGVGIPALREGNIIRLPSRTLEVAEACSGMRLMTGYVALGVAFAYLSRRPRWERVVLVLSTIPIAVLTNAGRVTWTAFLAHWGYNSLVEGQPHAATSLVLFAIAAAALWGEYYVLSHLFVPEASGEDATP
jgi:exosortase